MTDQNDQLKTPAEEDRDLAKVADKPSAPAESGSHEGHGDSHSAATTRKSPMKTGDVRGR